ncbi:ABC transporter substrate-binding protein [Cellulomonas carbonis]|uniref:ABC transporter substrate-binding protein n=1 Tax=Cellulomonas carbonis T26 TaxID=947969 RepID=A0A0A0BR60_9CELL|nr:ABC transporter substrate-binding protein [Cellulomonas carbonis]KGM10958.1 ABC transporter substrate-binding protein [Cellulomonas carbonis T26]GGC02420.1 ABC transporter substrate-binding protein [Cellulomonas carbonis]
MTSIRRIGTGLVAGGLTLALAACAGTGSTTSEGSGVRGATPADGDAVQELTFWSNHPGDSKEVEEELLAAFEEETGIAVNLVTAGANYEELAQRFNASLAGGDLPDAVVVSDVTWFNFALNDALAPMDDLWEELDVDSEGYVDALREDYAFDGAHYALPYARSTPIFYYNREMWEAAGLPDRGPETWEEFAGWAAQLKATDPDVAPLVVPDGSNYLDWYFQGMVWTFGGAYSDGWEPTFSSPGSIEAGQFLQDQVQAGHIAISNDANNQFGAGQAAALLQSTGSLSGLTEAAQFDFATAFLPGPQPGVTTGGAGIGIPAGIDDARRQAAMELVAFLTGSDSTVTFSQATGYMPVRKDAVDHPDTQGYLEEHPNFRTALEQLAVTQSQDNARVFVPGGGARIGAALDRITTGGEDVETVFAELDEETRTVFERDIEPHL